MKVNHLWVGEEGRRGCVKTTNHAPGTLIEIQQ